MNNRARHMQYRKSIYRKKRIKAIAVISALAIALLFILFLIIGNVLHKKTSDSPSKNNNFAQSSKESEATVLQKAESVGAYPLPLLENGSAFSDRLATIPANAEAAARYPSARHSQAS